MKSRGASGNPSKLCKKHPETSKNVRTSHAKATTCASSAAQLGQRSVLQKLAMVWNTQNCFGCEMLHRSLTMCRCYTKNLCHQRRTTSKRYTKNAKAGKAAIFIHISAKAFSSRQRGAETAIYIEFASSHGSASRDQILVHTIMGIAYAKI